MSLIADDPGWWITAIDLPALSGLFWLLWRLRDALASFRLEAAKTYAALTELRALEKRLVSHLLRIEAKLDTTAMKTEALRARNNHEI